MIVAASSGFADSVDLIAAVAWPLVVLAVAMIFRAPITELLRREDVEIKGPGGFSVSAKGQEAAAKALVRASKSKDGEPLEPAVAEDRSTGRGPGCREALGRAPRILWVDDQPSNNRYRSLP